MTRERRIFTTSEFDVHDTVSRYEAFGWQTIAIRGNQVEMSRPLESPIYYELVKLQAIYEDLVKRYNALKAPVKPALSADTEGVVKPNPAIGSMQNSENDDITSRFNAQMKAYDEQKKMLRTNIDAALVLGRTAVMLREKLEDKEQA